MSTDVAAGAGSKLRAAREGMEASPGEVADALNLPVKVIEALESDDYQGLPPTVFTRGYLRSYARLLELDPGEMLALYPDAQENAEVSEPVGRSASLLDQPGVKFIGIAAALVVLLVLLLVWLFSGAGEDDAASGKAEVGGKAEVTSQPGLEEAASPDQTSAAETAPLGQPLAQPARGEIDLGTVRARDVEEVNETVVAESIDRSQARALDPPAADRPSDRFATDQLGASTEKPDLLVSGPASHGSRRITEFGDDVLQFTFVDECWVEVKSTAGDNLYSDLSRAGATLTLEGRGPFRILLGYAPGVTLTFNGERVTLAPHTRNNVATLVLGQ